MRTRIAFLIALVPILCGALAAPVSAQELIRPGETVEGRLERRDPRLADDCYYDEYIIDCEVGTLLTITQSSDEFDSYLMVIGPDGSQWENDDYAGGGLNSRVSVVINERGEYAIICTSYEPEETGSYRLTVEERRRPRFFGVFVGIERYGGEWPDAPLCDEDAEKLYEAFLDSGLMDEDDGVLLTNRHATLAALEDAFDALGAEMDLDDVFVFFFSGHGSQTKAHRAGRSAEIDIMDECICLRDADLTDNDFADMLDDLDAGLMIAVLDACNSGGMAPEIASRPGRVCFASSEEDVLSDFAPELEAGGYLAVFFREAIMGAGDLDGDGAIMMGELTRFLLQRYYQEVPDPEQALYGYQELVHNRGLVSQDTIFCWWGPGELPRRPKHQADTQDNRD